MHPSTDLILEKPVSFLNSELKINFKEFFASLSKAAIAGTMSDTKGALEYGVDALKEIGVLDSAEQAAWTLVSTSLMQALTTLAKDYTDLFDSDLDEAALDDLAERVEYTLNAVVVSIDASFFNRPQDLQLLEDFKSALVFWLNGLGLDDYQAQAFNDRLKGEFIIALHDQWSKSPETYQCIEQQLNTPFTKATLEERAWRRYDLSLQNLANTRVFGEAFGLRRVYISLRAYYDENSNVKQDREITKVKKIVCDLHTAIHEWVKQFDKNNALRVISGGPGCGKSSFAKVLAADLAGKHGITVLFIPLHYFNLTDDLIQAVGNFVQGEGLSNPLAKNTQKERVLLIFDGLDELSMQGKAASDIALQFIDELSRMLERYNDNGNSWQAIVTGRDLSVQASESRLRKDKQILQILPYYLSDHEKSAYQDDAKILDTDQRNLWWQKFGKAKGQPYDAIPDKLATDHLLPITREPLLNYLLSLSFERKEIEFDDRTSLNNIYYDLLEAVHERQYAGHQHDASKHLRFEDFLEILEEIALAVWHGNGRTASESYLFSRCEEGGLTPHLENFSEGAKKGVVRLLTAFYFRQFGTETSGDRTFEFTHKSFGEYLTARRIVDAVDNICDEIARNKKSPRKGWTQQKALEEWIKITGSTAIDSYLFRFIKDEVSRHNLESIQNWQESFAELLGIVVREGSPMEQIILPNFPTMLRHSRNAEEALLIIHYTCALSTKTVLEIDWGKETKTNFGTWLKRIQGQRQSHENSVRVLDSCGYLNLKRQILDITDFWGGTYDKTNFNEAAMNKANFGRANLIEASFRNTQLYDSDFQGAILTNANLQMADLQNTRFNNASLYQANLTQAKLRYSSLRKANLIRANFEKAYLTGADLEEAELERANFKEATLSRVNLKKTELKDANFEGANLQGANLEGANLKDANFKGVNLKNANLKKTILEKADISQYIWSESKINKSKKSQLD